MSTLKRKIEDEAPLVVPSLTEPKKKKQKKKKPVTRDGEDFDDKLNLNLAISRMKPKALADYLTSRTKQLENKLSDVEVDDLRISEDIILDTTSWTETRTLEHMPAFLKNFSAGSDLHKTSKEKGSPHTIVIAGAGLRAADISRSLREFQTKDSMVAKLFAKHIKIQEAIDLCKGKRITIGIGTPHRINDLLEDGSLSTKHLKRVVIDASYIDQKRRGIIEMKDTHGPLIRLLKTPFLDGTELVLY